MPPQPKQPPLLRDIITIPEPGSVSDSDFVFKLVESLDDPAATAQMIRNYVITDRLLENYDEALGLVQSALSTRTSKAAYLHGSFGSGKSHFMGLLYSLLTGNTDARAKDQFAGLLDKYEPLLETDKQFLLVPYHMLGAQSLEQRVLGGYVKRIKEVRPNAPTPMVYRTDALFDNIQRTRANVGDQVFIAKLGTDATAIDADAANQDKWGERFGWTSELLDKAIAAPQASAEDALNLVFPTTPTELRAKLIHDALAGWFPGFFSNAQEDEHGFVALDRGLSVIAEHAKSQGFDALILFLDELILWLANGIQDPKFVAREVGKITNLVEGGDVRRAIPVVSFIARQRDMRDLLGDGMSGMAETTIQDTLKLASGRFDLISLEDRNLPVIANQRLLTPEPGKDPDGVKAAQLRAAFENTLRVRQEIRDTMLGSAESTTGADEDSFRLSYPFSPAFMDTLVQVSNALQRSRTGLKLMRQLLIDHRDDLRLGQVVPFGDLYQVISSGGDEPFTERLKAEFREAQRLYANKLRPYLLNDAGITEDDVDFVRLHPDKATVEQISRVRTFIGYDRLISTLLLSALAPSVNALRNMTIRRLVWLNHGSITSPIPGGEIGVVLNKAKDWASRFTEIKLVEGEDSQISLELIGVDVDSVIDGAKSSASNHGTNLIRKLLQEELGVKADQTVPRIDLTWRGSRRRVEVQLAEVADPGNREDSFAPSEDGLWRIVVDLPFNHHQWNPSDSWQRATKLKRAGEGTRTVFWIPAHFTPERRDEFNRLSVIDYILHDRRFDTHAGHLNPDDRQRAKTALEDQHRVLLGKFRERLKQAYGVNSKQSTEVTGYGDHLLALADVEPRLAFGESLAGAARSIADTLLAYQFPGHPDLSDHSHPEDAVRPAEVRTVFGYVRKAVENGDGITDVDRAHRQLMKRIADGLALGKMHEARFELTQQWREHFDRQAKIGNAPADIPVSLLAEWIDAPKVRGLEDHVANLVIASYAEQADRIWTLHNAPLDPQPEVDKIRPGFALREQPLPSKEHWEEALQRAAHVYGLSSETLLRGRLVTQFARDLVREARKHAEPVYNLVEQLEAHASGLGLDVSTPTGRLRTAVTAAELTTRLDQLGKADQAVTVVDYFATVDLGGPAKRLGRSIKSASAVTRAVAGAAWDFFDLLKNVPRSYTAEAEMITSSLHSAARADELTAPLPAALDDARTSVKRLLDRVNAERAAVEDAAAQHGASHGAVPATAPETPGELESESNPTIVPDQTAPEFPPLPAGGAKQPGIGRRRGTAGQFRIVLDEIGAEVAELARTKPEATVELVWRVVE